MSEHYESDKERTRTT